MLLGGDASVVVDDGAGAGVGISSSDDGGLGDTFCSHGGSTLARLRRCSRNSTFAADGIFFTFYV